MLNVKKEILGIISQGASSSSSAWLKSILRIALINIAVVFCICIIRTKTASTAEDVLLQALSYPHSQVANKQKNNNIKCSLEAVKQIMLQQIACESLHRSNS